MKRLVVLASAAMVALAGCSTGHDAVAQGGTFEFVAPGGKTDIFYDPPESRGRPGPLAGPELMDPAKTISLDDFIAPKVEAEIVFRLAAPLRGPGVTVEQAHAAIGSVMAGLEIVDSRIENWRIKLADTIADLASCGAAVLGQAIDLSPELDYRLVGMVFSRNGELVATGAGAAALGDPVAVVAWLANVLGEHGVCLDAGQVIMTGALHAAVPLSPGDTFTAEFDRLGLITLHVEGKANVA